MFSTSTVGYCLLQRPDGQLLVASFVAFRIFVHEFLFCRSENCTVMHVLSIHND